MATSGDIRQVSASLTGEDGTQNQPASGFTAVNGRSPPEYSNRSQATQQDGLNREQDVAVAPMSSNGANGATQSSAENNLDMRAPATSPGQHREDPRPSPGKRKRSLSAGVSPNTRSLSPSKRYRSPGHEQPDREMQPAVANNNAGNMGTSNPSNANVNGHQSNGVVPLEQDTRYGDPNAQHWNIPRDGEMPDAQFAEALARGTQQLQDPAQQLDEVDPSPDPKFASHTAQGGSHAQQPMSAIQSVPTAQMTPSFQKQRKRNFSNRTKTGCMTCRHRKKKCDEAKPACKNCERGGFHCQGYTQSSPNYKTTSIGTPVAPLQAKGGPFFEPYPFPNQGRAGPQQQQPPPPPLPAAAAAAAAPPPPPPQSTTFFPEHSQLPPTTERDRNPSNPQDGHLRAQYGRPSWPENPPSGPFPQDNLQPGPPLTDHRGERTLPPPPNAPPAGSQRSGSSSSHYKQLAQSALQHSGAATRSGTSQAQPWWSEKDKMLHSHPFVRNDPQLVEERKQCATACHKFNSIASDPQNLTDQERYQRFRQIIQPSGSTSTTRSPSGSEATGEGSVGERVSVEAPFNCEYGYNITIGDDTEIGPGCRIMDSCTVKIGARCYIGPNVVFYTTEGDQPVQLGSGARNPKRLTRAKAIIVEDDVYIAGNVIVQPGLRIGRSTTIAAGTTIDRNIKSTYTVYPDTKHGGADIVTGLWRSQPHGTGLS